MAAAASALIAILLAAGWLYNAAGWPYYKVHHRRDATPAASAQVAIAQAPSRLPAEQQVPPPPSKGKASPVAAEPPLQADPLQSDPELRAETLLQQHDYAQAVRYFTLALATKPNFRSYFGRASAYRQLGQMEKAAADYSQAILLNPDCASAYHDRALCEMRLGLERNAAEDYDKALMLDPTNPRTWNDRGAIYLKDGGYHKAQDCFSRAIELDRDFAAAYRNRAQAEKKSNDSAAAEEDLNKARALEQQSSKRDPPPDER
jgi:tetratricopeptide (TPR) repeat protein